VALIDFQERQLTLKLVYYGPPRSGKTTNLRAIHGKVDALNRGRLMTLDTRDDRTLFFDLLPIFFRTSNLSFRVKVYTVPGQPMHEATRRVVLRHADGVAFIADSQRAEIEANRASYDNLQANLDRLGLDAARTPIVIQYNKRDLPDVVPEAELESIGDRPLFSAVATAGVGVMDTFYGLLDATWATVDARVGLREHFGLDRDGFVAAIRAHVGGESQEPGSAGP
jgi:mutual gliding-motility protein MglA